jgi:flagellar hook-associated protein FlgK
MAESYTPFDPKKIPQDVFISGGTASKVKKYQGASLVDLYSDDITGANQNKLLQDFEGFSADYRKALAQKLKAAGYYRGDVTGKPTLKLQEAYFNAYVDLNDTNRGRLAAYTGDPAQAYNVQLDNLDTFLAKQDTGGEGGGAGGGINKIQYQRNLSLDSIEASIDKVFRDLTGSGATKAQIAKYTKNIQKQLANPKNLGQTEYRDMGGGVQRQITTEAAFDPESYLIEEVSKGDPAKASSVMGFYEVFNKFIGRG